MKENRSIRTRAIRPFSALMLALVLLSACAGSSSAQEREAPGAVSKEAPEDPSRGEIERRPNVVLIYADDLGYGDLSSYGATELHTPHIDQVAEEGLRFTRGYAPAATCTPSRYSLLTGRYAWRKEGTGIAPGDASLIIDTSRTTLPSILQEAGYTTGIVGKWHLGLGGESGPNWNETLEPGPGALGFDYSFLIPATPDRVPTVYVENGRVLNLDPGDPLRVSYGEPIGDEPTGRAHPELLTMKPSHGHDQTIVNGISRIGYMSGGTSARWVDEHIADTLASNATGYIERNQDQPFFLYLATSSVHVPRTPPPRFAGKSGLGPRGDALLALDGIVGEVVQTLERLDLADRTLVIFTSDNGPVLDDGYQDQAVEKLHGHTPSGGMRGGKYSAFEAGTRIPFIVRWPGVVEAGRTSEALVSQVDLAATLAALAGERLKPEEAPDSRNLLPAFLGRSEEGRDHLVQEATGTLALVQGRWKYIAPSPGPTVNKQTDIELGNSSQPQLYNLERDPGEQRNVAEEHPRLVEEMHASLQRIKEQKK